MVVGAISSRSELVVVGAGPGGYVAALRAADAGLDVALVDRADLGGTCLNVGCIPSKTLIGIANLRHEAVHAAPLGLTATVDVDMGTVADRLGSVSRGLRGGVAALLRNAGVTVVQAEAHFARYDRLSLTYDDQVSHLEFDNVIIATGSRPVQLADFPLSERVVDSTGALALTEVPAHLAIIGGGYIGVELGTAWAKLGASVTIIEQGPRVLPTMDPALSSVVEKRLGDLEIGVASGVSALHPTERGVQLSDGREIPASVIVVAVGRRPNSDQASIASLDVDVSPTGHIQVDSQMKAGPGVYAIGDLVAGPALAHKASAEAEVAVDAIVGKATTFAPAAIPEVVFSDPEIMSVGVSAQGAADLGYNVHRFPHAASARAQTMGATSGLTLLVTDQHETVVGVHAVGPHVSELAGEATLAIEMAATLEDIAMTIHAHPTMSETIAEAAHLGRGLPLHIRR